MLHVIRALNEEGIPYMLTGSNAANLYAIPRSTKDADFVVQLDRAGVDGLARRLPPEIEFEAQLSFETVTGTRRYILKIARSAFKIELFLLSDDAHDQLRFGRRRRQQMADLDVWVPTAEDVIITKLRWSRQGKRSKDLDDARNVIEAQMGVLDWPYIERWCNEHGTRAILDSLRAEIAAS
jgi:hypothetical protein